MKRRMIRYTVKQDRAAENETYITEVFKQLNREKPAGLRYAAFRLDDGVSFIHIVLLEGADGSGDSLSELPAFKAFRADIRDRCETQPVTVDLKEVGSYRFFGE
jgi:hypothetical protein